MKKIKYLLFIFVMFLGMNNCYAEVTKESCNGKQSACAICFYETDTFATLKFLVYVDSNNSVVLETDASKKNINDRYSIDTSVSSNNFVSKDNLKFVCNPRISYAGSMKDGTQQYKFSFTEGTSNIDLSWQYNNDKYLSSKTAAGISCKYGNVVIWSDGKNLTINTPSDGVKYSVSEEITASDFDVDGECPKFYLGCFEDGTYKTCAVIKNSTPGSNEISGVKEKNSDEINGKTDHSDEGTDITTCEGYLGPDVMNFVRLARNGIMIVGPILAVVLGTYEMAVGVAKGEDEDKKKALKRFKNRLIAAVLLLLTPYILEMILSFVNKSFGGCL